MSVRIAVKEVGEPLEIIEVEAKYRTEVLKKYIGEGAWFDYVNLEEHVSIGVNDDGHNLALPCNFFVLTPYNLYFPTQPILGTAVFFRTLPFYPIEDDWDIQLGSLSDSDLEKIKNLLSRTYQENCLFCFDSTPYGKGDFRIDLDKFD